MKLLSPICVICVICGCIAFPSRAATPEKSEKRDDPLVAAAEVRRLAKEADGLLAAGKHADAERTLARVVELAPTNPRLHFELARARAGQQKTDQAMDDLRRAAALGFTGFARIEREPDLAPLHGTPGFRALLDGRQVYLRRTAEGTLAALRNRFGKDGYVYAIDDEARLVYAVAADPASFDPLRAALAEQAAALHTALFPQKPEAYVAVVLPTAADYGKLVRFRNVPGLYVDATKSLVARERGTYVLPHEFTHALHAADVAPLGQTHAPWVTEGLGVLTESASFAGGTFQPRDNPRFTSLAPAARRKALVPLDRLVAMNQQEFVRRPNLTYGQSGYVMLYLWEQNRLRKFYDAYKATYAKDPTGRTALEQATGEPVGEFHEAWRVWLGERGAKPTTATTKPKK